MEFQGTILTYSTKRPRAYRACNWCRFKKTKCDGLLPCSNCVGLRECYYVTPKKRGRKVPEKKAETPAVEPVVQEPAKIEKSVDSLAFLHILKVFKSNHHVGGQNRFKVQDIDSMQEVWSTVYERRSQITFQTLNSQSLLYLRYSILFSDALTSEKAETEPFDACILKILPLVSSDLPQELEADLYFILGTFKIMLVGRTDNNAEKLRLLVDSKVLNYTKGMSSDIVNRFGTCSLGVMYHPEQTQYLLHELMVLQSQIPVSFVLLCRISIIENWILQIQKMGFGYLLSVGLSENYFWDSLKEIESIVLNADSLEEWSNKFKALVYANYAMIYSYLKSPLAIEYIQKYLDHFDTEYPGKWITAHVPKIMNICDQYNCLDFKSFFVQKISQTGCLYLHVMLSNGPSTKETINSVKKLARLSLEHSNQLDERNYDQPGSDLNQLSTPNPPPHGQRRNSVNTTKEHSPPDTNKMNNTNSNRRLSPWKEQMGNSEIKSFPFLEEVLESFTKKKKLDHHT
eukprot:TRINITY_DN4800_c0_g1_i1.p1 TRINITY_DN4800_c0_g1~~TRINITY_DN4800_c0_g1_i1.p1  ORF type:complete len:514 (+),score=97.44 TRINITY_DN4800_c0_g1_i1:31-1572(+)